jgi:hypothetical protein
MVTGAWWGVEKVETELWGVGEGFGPMLTARERKREKEEEERVLLLRGIPACVFEAVGVFI